MRPFKFFQDDTKRRIFTTNLTPIRTIMDDRIMRWVDVRVNNLNFRVYTHQSLDRIQHIIDNVIEPFIFEHNTQNNTDIILRRLNRRFHNAVLVM